MRLDRKTKVFILLNLLFVTFLLMAEMTGSKLIMFLGFTMTIGVIPFPATFIITDTLNEFYGADAVRRTTLLGMLMVIIAYAIIYIDLQIPAIPASMVDDRSFETVFAGSARIIAGSIAAYLIGQLLDIQVFTYLKKLTEGRHIWLRATGSTVLSQLIDSYVVIQIAYYGKISQAEIYSISLSNFVYKLIIAVLLTPVIYIVHYYIEKYFEEEEIRSADELFIPD